jgi:hypothetical protein
VEAGQTGGAQIRIAVWNTARRSAAEQVARLGGLSPDIAVLPELGRVPIPAPDEASSFVEVGATGRLGIGVTSWGEWHVALADVLPIGGQVVGAVDVDGPRHFKLVAVWADLTSLRKPAPNPVLEAVDAWGSWHAGHDLVVAGDFNTGGQWTTLRSGPNSHYPIVSRLAEAGLCSAYHTHHGIDQGDREQPTHWHANGKAYTIDHVFAPVGWELADVAVGPADPWKGWSDHAPVVAGFVIP